MTSSTLTLKPDPDPGSKTDHYVIYFGDRYVGRIYDRIPFTACTLTGTWFWGIDSGAVNFGLVTKAETGSAESKDEAMAVFRAAWDLARAVDLNFVLGTEGHVAFCVLKMRRPADEILVLEMETGRWCVLINDVFEPKWQESRNDPSKPL